MLVNRPGFLEWDYHPALFAFDRVYVLGGGTGLLSNFCDAKIQRLETMASGIGVGLALLAAAKTERSLKREAEE